MKSSIHIRHCSPEDLESILLCQKFVIESLVQSALYYPSSSGELEELLSCEMPEGFILGAFLNDFLYGFVSIKKGTGTYYGYRDHSSGPYYSIEDTLVMEEYRGLGTQRLLWQIAMSCLPSSSTILCTIHPENNISLSNATRLGFVQRKMCHPYDKTPRIILEKLQ